MNDTTDNLINMTDSALKQCTLVLAAHGSQTEPRAALHTHLLAAHIQALGIFHQVLPSFWKEAPEWYTLPAHCTASTILVVPLLMSEGYFAKTILPRCLEIGTQRAATEPIILTAPPVGIHPSLHQVAERILSDALEQALSKHPALTEKDFTLVVAGHGTTRDKQSEKSILDLVEKLRVKFTSPMVEALFLDQPPALADLQKHVITKGVILLPYFVSSGQHTLTDIPSELGLPTQQHPYNQEYTLPERDQILWYLEPVGTQPQMVQLIVDHALKLIETHQIKTNIWQKRKHITLLCEHLELHIHHTAQGEVELRHIEDQHIDASQLETFHSPLALWSSLRRDSIGADFAHVPTTCDRPRGWRLVLSQDEDIAHALELIFALPHTTDQPPMALHTLVHTLKGQYRTIFTQDEPHITTHIRQRCDQRCLKNRTWTVHENEQTRASPSPRTELDCTTPCAALLTELTHLAQSTES